MGFVIRFVMRICTLCFMVACLGLDSWLCVLIDGCSGTWVTGEIESDGICRLGLFRPYFLLVHALYGPCCSELCLVDLVV